jgi:serine/threonine protein kinase
LADGDVRHHIALNNNFDLAWKLRSLHHIAIGLEQLHKHNIAHQDLKPSNVLVFSKKTSKISDFGRSAFKGHTPPHENLDIPGDRAYAPPELLYGYVIPDWSTRRFGCDTYHLGSMVTYFFLGVQMTTLLRQYVPDVLWYPKWGGDYYDVIPYLNSAFHEVLVKMDITMNNPVKKELIQLVAQLCDPDPKKRGNITQNNASNQYSLEFYISKFNLLARKAELRLLE